MSTDPVGIAPSSVRPSLALTGPALVLTAVSLVLGLVPSLIDSLVTAADEALQPEPYEVHLAVWHGVNAALVGSVIATVFGACPVRPASAGRPRAVVRVASTRCRGRLRRCAPRSQPPRRPCHRDQPAGGTAGVRRRDPRHGGAASPVGTDPRRGMAGLAGGRRRPGARAHRRRAGGCRPRRRVGPPAFLGGAVPRRHRLRDGGALHRPGCARPGAHPGRHRDAVDRAFRPRVATSARSLHRVTDAPGTCGAHHHGARRGVVGVRAGDGDERSRPSHPGCRTG